VAIDTSKCAGRRRSGGAACASRRRTALANLPSGMGAGRKRRESASPAWAQVLENISAARAVSAARTVSAACTDHCAPYRRRQRTHHTRSRTTRLHVETRHSGRDARIRPAGVACP
jgi:hypothetical protein